MLWNLNNDLEKYVQSETVGSKAVLWEKNSNENDYKGISKTETHYRPISIQRTIFAYRLDIG